MSLTVVLCLGTSTGPVLADNDPSAAPTTTTSAEPSTTTSAPTARSEPTVAVEMADLRLSVWFEKPAYEVADEITAHASVTNAGTATANRVIMKSTGNLTQDTWYPFWPEGVTVAPGQTVEGTLTGFVSTAENAVRLVVTVSQRGGEPDANPEDNTVSASVPIAVLNGDYRGTVFGDRNGDGAQDPGEALAGVAVRISVGITVRTEITGAAGAFVFRDLPLGQYFAHVDAAGWYAPGVAVQVTGPDDPEGLIRAIPQVGGDLTMSLTFAQESYQVNDSATAILTLTNTGTAAFSGLTAECSLPRALHPDQADLGQLEPGRSGVTVPAGETRRFPFVVPVTERASTIGHVRLRCLVGAPPRLNGPFVEVTAAARVPGGVATRVTGLLTRLYDGRPPPWSIPLPGVQVYLRDSISGAIVARDISDADGGFTFCNLPVGPYSFGVVGPWSLWSEDFVFRADEDDSSAHMVYVQPGPYQPDPPGRASSGCGGPPPDAAPPGGRAPELAVTGAGVTRLALSGLLTLLVGTGLVLLARQRPSGPGSGRT